jgi:hypothetical protein
MIPSHLQIEPWRLMALARTTGWVRSDEIGSPIESPRDWSRHHLQGKSYSEEEWQLFLHLTREETEQDRERAFWHVQNIWNRTLIAFLAMAVGFGFGGMFWGPW